jgi:hypothetical protein
VTRAHIPWHLEELAEALRGHEREPERLGRRLLLERRDRELAQPLGVVAS